MSADRILSRRQLIKASGVAGLAVAALSTGKAAAQTTSPSIIAQGKWLWCQYCEGLYNWGSSSGFGVCYGNNYGIHSVAPSYDYTVKETSGGGGGQSGWYFCSQCCLLHYGSGSVGWCAIGGGAHHVSAGSYNYMVEYTGSNDGAGGQDRWRHCINCQGLWYDNGGVGSCPGFGGHNPGGSYDYKLRYTTN